MGKFQEIQSDNRNKTEGYKEGIYSYVRYSDTEKLIVVNNFSWVSDASFDLKIPAEIIRDWKLNDGNYNLVDKLYGQKRIMSVKDGLGIVKVEIGKSESFIFEYF